jgi:hypothetical protein
MLGRPVGVTSDSSYLSRLLRKFGILEEDLLYKFNSLREKNMSSLFLWGGLTMFVAFSAFTVPFGMSFAGLLMVIGWILLVLGK